jgi:hypothetical protein
MERFEDIMRKGGATAVAEATRFFMKDDRVHQTFRAITQKLQELQIPYAVVGGMAVVAHGYDRTTDDVDILVNSNGLKAIHRELEGLGYLAIFAGSKNLRDARTGVRIEFLITGQYPGDGKPKPVAFPEPVAASKQIGDITYVRLDQLLELKLASGMSLPSRLKDLADVQELIRVLKLPLAFADKLNPYVRDKFTELWTAVKQAPPEE